MPKSAPLTADGTTDNVACEQCIYWERLDASAVAEDYGFCRRYAPPAVTISKAAEFEARWPLTHESEWCGEHHQRMPTVAEHGATNT